MNRALTRLARVLAVVALMVYPLIVWRALAGATPRAIALVLLCVLVPAALVRRRTDATHGLAWVPLVTIGTLVATSLLDSAGLFLLVPIAINATLLIAFAGSLRKGSTPAVERFARTQDPNLDAAQVAWCRRWTLIWCAFFATNASVAALLAWFAPLAWWAFYNGVLAYLLIGTLVAVEWLLRVRRFPRAVRPEPTR